MADGVFVMIVTGVAYELSVCRVYPVLSVMFKLKVSVGFVDTGFVMPLNWILKV